MAKDIHPARGMRDILPEEKALRERTLQRLRAHYARFGYREIETPALEDLERLASGQGGENEKLIFKVLRRGLAEDASVKVGEAADLGLRYDLTLPLARFYATHRDKLGPVFRSIQIGPVWRAERPQRGRFRQFLQCDIDVVGEPSILAESELITATLSALRELGVEGCSLRLNDRRILSDLLDSAGVDRPDHNRALVTIDKLDKIGLPGVEAELQRSGIAQEVAARLVSLLSVQASGFDAPFALGPQAAAALEELSEVREAVLAVLGDAEIVFDPALVRGMGYYTGAVFEVAHSSSPASLAGGGRYDGMIGRFIGSEVPACGFSIGFERIVELLGAPQQTDELAVAIVHTEGCTAGQLLSLQAQLISQGCRTRLQRRPKRLGRTLDALSAQGFSHFVLVDADTSSVLREELEPIDDHS